MAKVNLLIFIDFIFNTFENTFHGHQFAML